MSRSRKKQPYRASRQFDPSCRCHGGCPWCYGNRMYQDSKERAAANAQLREHMQDDPSDDDTRWDRLADVIV